MATGWTVLALAAACSGSPRLAPTEAATAVPAVAPASTAVDTPAASARTTAAAPAQAEDAPAVQAVGRPEGWREETHGNDVEPNYQVVFPQDRVSQIAITIEPDRWDAMQANMAELLGPQRTGRGAADGGVAPPGGAPPGDLAPAGRTRPGGLLPGDAGVAPGAMGANPDMTPVNPMWVTATVSFNGESWTSVGVRYKGNSTLAGAWREGSAKLPWKLDFDEFEDEFPEIKNQRFYGFKQLSLGNNLHDASYMRDAISHDVMQAAGLVAPETAFYEVFLDTGDGPVRLGLYTMVEVVDDTVVERSFDDADGNIYEADGAAASLAAGTAGQIAASFHKENNREAADWSDIEALFDALHSAQRTSDAAAWRASLEAVFDVDTFLRWLAVNAVIQDWDTYGSMSHNYYLYHDPVTGQLVWISWDHNEAMSSRGRGDTSLDKAGVGSNWPLIRYLLEDPVFHDRYVAFLRSAIENAFDAGDLAAKYDAWAALLRPYVEQEGNAQAFDSAVAELKAFAATRVAEVEAFLARQP